MRQLVTIMVLGVLLAACGTTRPPPPRTSGGGEYKVGAPYKVGGQWYTPAANPYYDEVGMASWYGKQFHGKSTANGERFDMNKLSAAHKTLPMPSFVRVTNLSNGRSLVLRINDRGPFAQGRIIDLSRRAAQLLGFEKKGVERVRVQATRADGRPLARKISQDKRKKKDTRMASAGTAAANIAIGDLYVQIGSFSARSNAEMLVPRLKGLGTLLIQTIIVEGRRVHRLRIGPFADQQAAYAALKAVRRRGFADARVFTEPIG